MKVLITGAAGYIGSTIASACLDEGIVPVVLDNLVTGREEFTRGRAFYRGDIADGGVVDRIFAEHPDIAATVHCAALVVVPESVADPVRYYRENVAKTVELVAHLLRNGCERVVFSSSASIYAPDGGGHVDESSPISASSPYARTKAITEMVLADIAAATPLRVVALRYFNPIGADPKLRTGLQAANPSHVLGKLFEAHRTGTPFRVTGVDWPTRDGSAIRDYIHVWDLALAHVAALRKFDEVVPAAGGASYEVINIGTGDGTTVRELVDAFQRVVGARLVVEDAEPRPGDVIGCYTDSDKAAWLLEWKTELGIAEAIEDSLRWSERRPLVLGE
ncbi:UDP-glucose 4-epimerase GalE [Saccharothrix hoggarensis]|uniref:UDP-glucose 4-epimerase n=1 Tax=Saccharothrix hoggarensis TaxID=913853 RepID=A0ABW3R4U7_9PSEU